MDQIQIRLKNYEKLKADLQQIQHSSAAAVKATINDMRRHVPGWVADAVTQSYNIRKSEITPQSKTAKKKQKKAVSIWMNGDTIETATLTYTGRPLTITHFGMKPKQRPKKKRYKVTAQIMKGNVKALGPKAFIATNRGTGQIAFWRETGKRYPIKAAKTVSVPQMIQRETVEQDIAVRLNKGLKERSDHNFARALSASK